MTKYPKKLIEVAMPLDDINKEAAREKSIRHGHPSTLHLWWARRPLAAARAVLFAQLVNDPGGERGWQAYPGQTKEDANRERERLFDIIHQQLVEPDLLIYLHAPVNRLQANIRKRNRSYEQAIPDNYLFSIQETYTHYIKQHNIKTLFIDASNADFLGNEKHLQTIIEALEKEYSNGQHYLTLP